MRLAWAGIVVAGIGLVLAALLWTFAVADAVGAADSPVCLGRAEFEVPCEVLGIDMRYGSLAAVVVFTVSALLAYVSIRMGQGPRRSRRDED